MTQYKISWTDFVNEETLSHINSLVNTSVAVDTLRPYLVSICSNVGGLNITSQVFDTTQQKAIILKLLGEGLSKVIAENSVRPTKGYIRKESTIADLTNELLPVNRININTATKADLDALPDIGMGLAQQIIEERLRNGLFTSLEELAERIHGIGETTIENIRYYVVVNDLTETLIQSPNNNIADQLKWLMNRIQAATSNEALLAVLNLVAVTCSENPHPFTENYEPRNFDIPYPEVSQSSDWVSPLNGSAYYNQIKELIENAQQRIDVCMFHIALPTIPHPTLALLDALIEAKNKGVNIRVLMDADRPSDPYLSTVINTPSKAYLEAAGVPVRFDETDVLLHSKFLIVDQDIAIVGSHNWSAGSYFQFDDLSMAVKSSALVEELSARFDGFWGA